MRNKLIVSVVLAAALMAGPAVAQQEPEDRSAAVAPNPELPDQTLGMALMSAYVNAAGELVHGAGAVSAERVDTGIFFVYFDRSIVGCTHVASMSVGAGSAVHFGTVNTAAPASGTTNAVRVRTFFPSSTDAFSQPFSLVVFCTQ